jgi:hypothetical protein
MPFTVTGKNTALAAVSGTAVFASLHTAQPTQTAPAEVSGGTPAYARKAITWTVNNGTANLNEQPNFDVPPTTTITYVGFWSAATGGNLIAFSSVTEETFGAQGVYVISDANLVITD